MDRHLNTNAYQQFNESKIETPDCTYTPFVHDGLVGYVVRWPNGKTTYLLLNPSTEDDDGQPNVFVYVGQSRYIGDAIPVVYVPVSDKDGL